VGGDGAHRQAGPEREGSLNSRGLLFWETDGWLAGACPDRIGTVQCKRRLALGFKHSIISSQRDRGGGRDSVVSLAALLLQNAARPQHHSDRTRTASAI
jgi:hypothetical protein